MDTSSRRKFFQQQCAPVFKEYQLMREFVLFQQQNLTNIYIVPAHASAFKWFGVIFIHHGLYQGAILRFTLTVSQEYPCHEAPKIVFDTIPFHPLVHPKTGELDTSKAFPLWNPNVNHLWQLVLFAKKIFYNLEKIIEEESEYTSLNPSHDLGIMFHSELVKMFRENKDDFLVKIAETVADCHARIYEPPQESGDPNAIVFGPWNPEVHEQLRRKLLTGKGSVSEPQQDGSTRAGLSFLNKDSMQIFSTSTPRI
jgi:ubiquitin-protein ligase